MALLNLPAPTVLEPKTAPATDESAEGDRRYGTIALTRRPPRDELHHSTGRDLWGCTAR